MLNFDQRFYDYLGPIALADIMRADPDLYILHEGERYDVAESLSEHLGALSFTMLRGLDQAGQDELSFLTNKKYLDALSQTQSRAVVTFENAEKYIPQGMIALLTKAPHRATARILNLLGRLKDDGFFDMAPGSSIASSAKIGERCKIAPSAFIGRDVEIGDECVIAPGAVIGCGVVLGRGCEIGPNATLRCCYLGDGVTIRAGASIGDRGFGFSTDGGSFEDIPHFGSVKIGHYVEIGCNSTIDRGSVGDTIIGDGTKIDNLVMIGHNVQMGRQCILAAQVGISGSTILGDGVMCGGQVGIAGHIRIGDGVVINAKSGVMSDLDQGKSYMGYPADEKRIFMKKHIAIKQLLNKK